MDYKEKLGEEVNELLKDFVNKNMKRTAPMVYTGRVEDNKDPDKLGRCKVRVFGVFDNEDILTADLPWAQAEQTFVGSLVGNLVVPPVNTIVRVYFDNDDIYSPVYTTKATNTNQLPTSIRDEDYPNTLIFWETDNGDYVVYNRETLEFQFHHASGININIDSKGNIKMDTTTVEEGTGNIDILAKGTITIDSKEGDIKLISQKGNVSIEAPKKKILLGGDSATQPVPNVPVSDYSGSPHAIGQQLSPGAVYLRP